MAVSQDAKHNRITAMDGTIIHVDPNVEPLVQPARSGFLEVWNLEAYGQAALYPDEMGQYHVVRQFARKEDAVMIHDLLMAGKISWRQALRTIIERE